MEKTIWTITKCEGNEPQVIEAMFETWIDAERYADKLADDYSERGYIAKVNSDSQRQEKHFVMTRGKESAHIACFKLSLPLQG